MYSPFKIKSLIISKAGSSSPVKNSRFVSYNNNNNNSDHNRNNDINTVMSWQSSTSSAAAAAPSNSMRGMLIDVGYPYICNSFKDICQIIVPKTDKSAKYNGRNKLQNTKKRLSTISYIYFKFF